MKKAEKVTRAELLELIDGYCSGIDEKGLACVLEMARCCWKEAKRKEATAEAAAAIRADRGKILYLFSASGSSADQGE